MNRSYVHVFTAAGLGNPPFTFTGMDTVDEDHCCFCRTLVKYRYHLQSANGQRFFVGSECIKKSGDAALIDELKAIEKRLRHEARDAELQSLRAFCEQMLAAHRGALGKLPHPKSEMAAANKTAADYCNWLAEGRAWRTLAAFLKARLKEQAYREPSLREMS